MARRPGLTGWGREQIAQELPDLQMRDQMRKDARDEATLSGDVRRAIRASDLSLLEIATQAGITPILLDDFLSLSQVR